MAVCMIIEIPGVTAAQYDAVMKELDLGGKLAPGALCHLAGPMEGGWRIIDAWERLFDFQMFFRGRFERALKDAGIAEFTPKVFKIHDMMTG